MIDGDLFVFDSAIHVHDLSNENVRDDVTEATYVRDHMLSAPVKARPDAFEGMPDPGAADSRRRVSNDLRQLRHGHGDGTGRAPV